MSTSVRRHISEIVRIALDTAGVWSATGSRNYRLIHRETAEGRERRLFVQPRDETRPPYEDESQGHRRGLCRGAPDSEIIGNVWVAGPGFVNFALDHEWLQSQVDRVIEQDETFGNSDIGGGESVQVESVSVNPTGPFTWDTREARSWEARSPTRWKRLAATFSANTTSMTAAPRWNCSTRPPTRATSSSAAGRPRFQRTATMANT